MPDIDLDWAWKPFEPDAGAWTRRLAAHLFRRAGFSANFGQLEAAVQSSPQEIVHDLVSQRSETSAEVQGFDALGRTILATADVKNLPAWWVHRFLMTRDPLREKTTLFWHGHFATSGEKVTESKLMYEQNQLLREHALGDFKKMVQGIAQDPAMLIYLDSITNRKAHPNENFAREVMELFCLGEGEYTETDIRELSRCFTGWEIRNSKFRFNRYQHDFGEKTILGQTGKFSGEEGVDIVLQQPAAAYFIAGKLVRFFVFDDAPLDKQLLKPLADQLIADDFQSGPTIERILTSNLFFSEHAIGRKVRSPIEFAVGFLRTLEGTTDLYALASGLNELGQTPFFPPNVKGWDGGRTWINSSTLLARANLIHSLLHHKATRFAGEGLNELMQLQGHSDSAAIVNRWEELFLAVDLPDEVKEQLAQQIDSADGDREQKLRTGLHNFCTLPEFQLC